MKARLPLLAAVLLSACSTEPAPLITVSEARVIALPSSAGAYFTLINSGGGDRLLSVDAGAAGKASLHETAMDGGIMRMRMVEGGIEVPAGATVRLAPSGKHVMIERLARPLSDGARLSLTLRFEHQGEVRIAAPVSGPR